MERDLAAEALFKEAVFSMSQTESMCLHEITEDHPSVSFTLCPGHPQLQCSKGVDAFSLNSSANSSIPSVLRQLYCSHNYGTCEPWDWLDY